MSDEEKSRLNWKEMGILITLLAYLVAGIWGAASFQQWVKSEFEVSRRQDERLSNKIERINDRYESIKMAERISVLESRYKNLEKVSIRTESKVDRILEYVLSDRKPELPRHQQGK